MHSCFSRRNQHAVTDNLVRHNILEWKTLTFDCMSIEVCHTIYDKVLAVSRVCSARSDCILHPLSGKSEVVGFVIRGTRWSQFFLASMWIEDWIGYELT